MPITQWAKTLCSVENMIYRCPHLDEAESDTTEPYVKRHTFAVFSASFLPVRQHWRTQDLKKGGGGGGGVAVEGDHQKGEGAGGGCAPSSRSAEAFENVNSVC